MAPRSAARRLALFEAASHKNQLPRRIGTRMELGKTRN
jgi:hypothetical protein